MSGGKCRKRLAENNCGGVVIHYGALRAPTEMDEKALRAAAII